MSSTESTLNFKTVAYGLLTLLIGTLIYIFSTNVSAQKDVDTDQSQDIANIQASMSELIKSNVLLTRIVQEHEDQLKGRATKPTPQSNQ